MATEAQIAANRASALKSTGPKSVPGKAVSSQNSSKHGFSASTTAALLASDSDRAFLEERKALWRPDFDPQGPEEEHLFEVVVAESIRVERCRDAYFALCREHGRRARAHWDADRRRAADALALRLSRAPHEVARRIEETRQGCDLMLEYWRGLASGLDRHATWTEAQRSLALDLLGVHPDLRDAETPVDPAEGDALEARSAVVAAEVARLTSLRDGVLAESDAHERALAESTLGAELTKPIQLMHRYESAALRRQRSAWARLDAARKARGPEVKAKAEAEPAAIAPPVPRPAPARPATVPAIAVAPPPRPVAPPVPDREPSRPMNRRQRRARAAMTRQAAR